MRRIAVNLLARLKSQGKNVGKSNVECRRDTRKGGHYFLIAIFLMTTAATWAPPAETMMTLASDSYYWTFYANGV